MCDREKTRATVLTLEPYCQGCPDIEPTAAHLKTDGGDIIVNVFCDRAEICRRIYARIAHRADIRTGIQTPAGMRGGPLDD